MRHSGAPSGPYQAGHNSFSGTFKAAEMAACARSCGFINAHDIVHRAKPLRRANSASGVPAFRRAAIMSARCQPASVDNLFHSKSITVGVWNKNSTLVNHVWQTVEYFFHRRSA